MKRSIMFLAVASACRVIGDEYRARKQREYRNAMQQAHDSVGHPNGGG